MGTTVSHGSQVDKSENLKFFGCVLPLALGWCLVRDGCTGAAGSKLLLAVFFVLCGLRCL